MSKKPFWCYCIRIILPELALCSFAISSVSLPVWLDDCVPGWFGTFTWTTQCGMSPGRDIWLSSSLPRRKRVRALAYQVIVVHLLKLDKLNLAISICVDGKIGPPRQVPSRLLQAPIQPEWASHPTCTEVNLSTRSISIDLFLPFPGTNSFNSSRGVSWVIS